MTLGRVLCTSSVTRWEAPDFTGKLTLFWIRVRMYCDLSTKAYKGFVFNPNSLCVSAQQGKHIHQNVNLEIKYTIMQTQEIIQHTIIPRRDQKWINSECKCQCCTHFLWFIYVTQNSSEKEYYSSKRRWIHSHTQYRFSILWQHSIYYT